MDPETISVAQQHLDSISESIVFQVLLCLIASILIWRMVTFLYNLAASEIGVHYVKLERRALETFTNYSSFVFNASYSTASYSGVKCTLKSQQACYVQAFWGVPIYSLFHLLHGDYQSLKNAITTHIPAEKFSNKCICANDPFILSAGEEKEIEFKPRWHADEATLSQEAKCLREIYPFVVLMVLKGRDEIHESYAVAMASIIHINDRHLVLSSQLLGQYIKLSSGIVGLLKNMYLSSPATSEDGGENYDLCLACYHRPVSRVFLPCRHACLCSVCFDLCERCPVCRGASMYYFELPDPYRRNEP